MPFRKEEGPSISEIISQIDEPLKYQNTKPFVRTNRVALLEVEQQGQLCIAQLFIVHPEKHIDQELNFLNAIKQHAALGPYVHSSWSELHRKGQIVGLLFQPPQQTKRLKDLQQLFYSIDRAKFNTLENTLAQLPQTLWVEPSLLIDMNMLYRSDDNPQEPRIQLFTISAGSFDNQAVYAAKIRTKFPPLTHRYCRT